MDKRESIKLKIKALLAKTTENGATEQEALSALQKAKDLMMENFISEHEITDPYLAEKCVFKKIARIHSAYNVTIFLGALAQLFDCEHYYNQTEVVFFGFEEDTNLCAYFYSFIINACIIERKKYTKTDAYKQLKKVHNGKTLVASFVRGFLIGIHNKMNAMYKERNQMVSDKVGLMILDKIKKVQQQFKQENDIKLRSVKVKGGIYEAIAFNHGKQKGNDLSLSQGVENRNRERTLKIGK